MALPFSSATGGVPVAPSDDEIGHVAAGFAGAVQIQEQRPRAAPLRFVQQRFVGLRVFDLLEMLPGHGWCQQEAEQRPGSHRWRRGCHFLRSSLCSNAAWLSSTPLSSYGRAVELESQGL